KIEFMDFGHPVALLSRHIVEAFMGVIGLSFLCYIYFDFHSPYQKKNIFIFFLILSVAILSTLGTNSGLIFRATHVLGLFGCLLAILVHFITNQFKHNKIFIITVSSIIFILCAFSIF